MSGIPTRPPQPMPRVPVPRAGLGSWTAWLRGSDLMRLAIIDVTVFIAMSLAMPGLFLSHGNLLSMAVQFPGYGLLALAMAVPMITGGIDLSIISLSNLAAILAALTMRSLAGSGSSAWSVSVVILSVALSLAVGALGGLLNGLIISSIGVTPILATLATGLVFSGIAVVLTGGSAIFGLPAAFSWIGNGGIAGLPVPVVVFALAAALLSAILSRTAFGAKAYLLGANVVASAYAGIDTRTVLLKTYATSGLYAATAGLVIAARANSAKADYGSAYLLLSILICVLAGVSPFGGSGRVLGIVLAVLALQFLSSGLNLLGVNTFATELVWGAVLLLAMVLSQRRLTQRG